MLGYRYAKTLKLFSWRCTGKCLVTDTYAKPLKLLSLHIKEGKLWPIACCLLKGLTKGQFLVLVLHFLLYIWKVLLPVGAHECLKSVEVIKTADTDWTSNNKGRSNTAKVTVGEL